MLYTFFPFVSLNIEFPFGQEAVKTQNLLKQKEWAHANIKCAALSVSERTKDYYNTYMCICLKKVKCKTLHNYSFHTMRSIIVTVYSKECIETVAINADVPFIGHRLASLPSFKIILFLCPH